MEENLCDDCIYSENVGNEFPCNKCIKWVDGYLEFTQYKRKEVIEC